MKVFWNRARHIERYLWGRLSPNGQQAVTEQVQMDAAFAEKVYHQQQVYELVQLAGRRELKRELRQVEARLMREEPCFFEPPKGTEELLLSYSPRAPKGATVLFEPPKSTEERCPDFHQGYLRAAAKFFTTKEQKLRAKDTKEVLLHQSVLDLSALW
jgi:hypothetical protein